MSVIQMKAKCVQFARKEFKDKETGKTIPFAYGIFLVDMRDGEELVKFKVDPKISDLPEGEELTVELQYFKQKTGEGFKIVGIV